MAFACSDPSSIRCIACTPTCHSVMLQCATLVLPQEDNTLFSFGTDELCVKHTQNHHRTGAMRT